MVKFSLPSALRMRPYQVEVKGLPGGVAPSTRQYGSPLFVIRASSYLRPETRTSRRTAHDEAGHGVTVEGCRFQPASQRGGSSGIWPPPVLGGRLDVPSYLPNFVEQNFGALGCIGCGPDGRQTSARCSPLPPIVVAEGDVPPVPRTKRKEKCIRRRQYGVPSP